MQIAARRVAAQRPARRAGLLPGRNGQRVLKQARKRVDRDIRARYRTAKVEVIEAWRERRLAFTEQRQVNQRRTFEATEWIRLIGPIELSRTVCITAEPVLGALVIAHHRLDQGDVVDVVCGGDVRHIKTGPFLSPPIATVPMRAID